MKAADDGIPVTVAPVEEIQLYVRDADGAGRDVTFMDRVAETNGSRPRRTDLQETPWVLASGRHRHPAKLLSGW